MKSENLPEVLSIKLAWLEVSAVGNFAIVAVIFLAILFVSTQIVLRLRKHGS